MTLLLNGFNSLKFSKSFEQSLEYLRIASDIRFEWISYFLRHCLGVMTPILLKCNSVICPQLSSFDPKSLISERQENCPSDITLSLRSGGSKLITSME